MFLNLFRGGKMNSGGGVGGDFLSAEERLLQGQIFTSVRSHTVLISHEIFWGGC